MVKCSIHKLEMISRMIKAAGSVMADKAVKAARTANLRVGLGAKEPWGKPYTDQTWIEIDCAALRHNLKQYREMLGAQVSLMPIVKSNAYGHGMLEVSKEMIDCGVEILGVVNINEALQLRKDGVLSRILVLGYTDPERAAEIPKHCPIALAVYDLENARMISRVAERSGRTVALHLKIDSGLHRLGVFAEDALSFVRGVADLPNIVLEGVFTHFADAETPEHEYTAYQLRRFAIAVKSIREAGFTPKFVHATASAGALCMPETRFSLVRLGIALYGLWPSSDTKLLAEHSSKVPNIKLIPALSWHTRIIQIKELPAGAAVGYGCSFHTKRQTKLAVLPVGYADGYDRKLSGCGEVLIGGKRAQIVGRICMNMCMVDVTDLPGAKSGDAAILIGKDGDEEISAFELGAKVGTINYEITTRINWNIKRVYKR